MLLSNQEFLDLECVMSVRPDRRLKSSIQFLKKSRRVNIISDEFITAMLILYFSIQLNSPAFRSYFSIVPAFAIMCCIFFAISSGFAS